MEHRTQVQVALGDAEGVFGMRQLWQTGWMHNGVRMIVGSLLVKHLLQHWLEGARWFRDTLVDADLANNTLGRQWIGGCGAAAGRLRRPASAFSTRSPRGRNSTLAVTA